MKDKNREEIIDNFIDDEDEEEKTSGDPVVE